MADEEDDDSPIPLAVEPERPIDPAPPRRTVEEAGQPAATPQWPRGRPKKGCLPPRLEAKARAKAEKLIPSMVDAVLGAQSFRKAAAPLSDQERKIVARVLKPDVDQWRAEFCGKLRDASDRLLKLTVDKLEAIPPASRGYTLAVLVDKLQALEGKVALSSSNVNVQINHWSATHEDGSPMSKAELMALISGRAMKKAEPAEPAPPSPPPKNAD